MLAHLEGGGRAVHNPQDNQNLSQILSGHDQYQFWRDEIKEQPGPSAFLQPEDV